MVDLKENLKSVKDSLKDQREALGETKKSVEDIFELAKLANIMFFFVIVSMFVILILNSVAGLV